MRTSTLLIIGFIILAATANAATTNLNNQRIRTYDLFAEGKAAIGTTWNTTEWGLVVVNGSTLNSTVRIGGNLYVEGATDFNGSASGIPASAIDSGTVARARLPTEICYEDDCLLQRGSIPAALAYEDETNTFTLRQAYDAGFTAGANAYFTALLQANGTFAAQTFAYVNQALQTNGTIVGKANSYLEGPTYVNATTLSIQDGGSDDTNLSIRSTTASGGIPQVDMYSSRGTGILVDGDVFGRYAFFAWDGNSYARCGVIQSSVEGAPGNGDMPSQLQFFTCADGTETLTQRLAIHNDGRLEIEGALDHDGSAAGLYSKTPVAQAADIVPITDSTGGTSSNTCAAITAGVVYSQTDMNNAKQCLASLIARVNELELALDNIGITA